MGRNKVGEPTLVHHHLSLVISPPIDLSSVRARSMSAQFPMVSPAPGVDLTQPVFSKRLANE